MTRIQIEIMLGTIMVLITTVVLVMYGFREEERMAHFALGQRAQAIEVGASLYEINCSTCHGFRGEGIPGLAPALNDEYFFDGRLVDLGWGGTQEDYIISTISTGRVVSTRPDQFVGGGRPAMPAWSEHYGGPLREDQIENIAAYIMNWEATAGQFPSSILPAEPVGDDITVELPEGDPQRGEALANSKGCVACHVSTPTGPAWLPSGQEAGIGTRAETRIEQDDYTGQAADAYHYLFESIVLPDVHIVSGYAPGIMPQDYDQTLSPLEVADLIAYMLTIR
jgi:mono/diheme cytochrome c family protein